MTSTSNGLFTGNAQERLRLWRERFAELMTSFEDFHARLESALETSSEGLPGVPLSSLPPSDSQAV